MLSKNSNTDYDVTWVTDVHTGGGGATGYVYTQSVVASIWTITHNLGWFPNVTVIDSAGTTVEGDTTQVNSNQLTIRFSGAFTGVAYLS